MKYNPDHSPFWNRRHMMWYGTTDPTVEASSGMVALGALTLGFLSGSVGLVLLAPVALAAPSLWRRFKAEVKIWWLTR